MNPESGLCFFGGGEVLNAELKFWGKVVNLELNFWGLNPESGLHFLLLFQS